MPRAGARRSRTPPTACARRRAAGLTVIAVPHPKYPPAPDALTGARLVLSSLAELTPDAVAALGG